MKRMILGLFLFALTGCTTNHFSEAILYKQASGNVFNIPETGNNPIYVDSNSIFSIKIDYMQPGWIHNGKSVPALNDENHKGFSRNITSHLYGKELWLLTKVESLSSEDVLERNGKIYFKTTNIKLNSESFAKIAFDEIEKNIFSHAADNQYRITFKLYEVDGFNIKKAAVKAYDDSPGLATVFISLGETITSTFGALAGSVVTDLWKSASEEELFVERLLLENDATLEFKGTVHILRKNDILSANPILEENYILYDKFKSDEWDTAYNNKASYKEKKKEKDQSVNITSAAGEVDTKTYIKIKITQGLSKQASAAKNITPSNTHSSFLESVKVD